MSSPVGPVSDPSARQDSPSRAVTLVRIANGGRTEASDTAAVEEPLQIVVNGAPFAVIMRTPGADSDLTAGFLLGERIVIERGDLIGVMPTRSKAGVLQHNVVEARLTPEAARRLASVKRSVTTTSSCGLCGRQNIDSLISDGLRVESSLIVDARRLAEYPRRMRVAQQVFEQTGGLHAAALFDEAGAVVAIAEDVGRHNAVDKVLGRRWWASDWPLSNAVLCVSGRTSFEILQKAVVAGVPVVVAVSAPSTLAIELADRAGVTLAGFVREGRMNVYTHPTRIVGH